LTGGAGVGWQAAEFGDQRSEVFVAEPVGLEPEDGNAVSSAWLRGCPRRSPGIRVPVAVITVSVS